MRISVEQLRAMQVERDKINRAKLKDIEFFENGKRLKITKQMIDKFELSGLNNIDFILTGAYKSI